MYFIHVEHEQNYAYLCDIYAERSQDKEYKPAIYIAAVPEIFEALDLEELLLHRDGPLATLTEYDENRNCLVVKDNGLSAIHRRFIEIGMSLYNGNPCDLNVEPTTKSGMVILQAIMLRFGL